jgi:uncharacterized protein
MGLQPPLRQPEKPPVSSSFSINGRKNIRDWALLNTFRRQLAGPLTSSVHPPWFDARGVGIGLFVGVGVPFGTQLIFLALLRLFFRFNSVVAFAFTWVNNPITLLPMYFGCYCLGTIILGRSIIMNADDFRNIMHPIIHAAYFLDSLRSFLYVSRDLIERWAVGALTVGAATGAIGYVAGYIVRKELCKKKARQLGITYDNLVKKLELHLGRCANSRDSTQNSTAKRN